MSKQCSKTHNDELKQKQHPVTKLNAYQIVEFDPDN